MIATERSRYSVGAIWLHWIIAAIVIANLIGGLTLDVFLESADPARKQLGYTIIGLHKSLGLTVIALTLVRIGWRIANPPPPLPSHMTRLEVVAARTTHIGFYGLMLAMPLSGWAMSSTGKSANPIAWFGLFDVPLLPLPKSLGGVFHESHELIGWLFIGVIVLHVLGALKHHVFDRDDVLARMLPFLRRKDA